MTGTVRLASGRWEIEAAPHIKTKLKALFPKISKSQYKCLLLTATAETARDLEWFSQRYPLEFEGEAQAEVERLSRIHVRQVEKTQQILSGNYLKLRPRMALPARDYQRDAAALARAGGGLLVGDELGLGKTVTALATLPWPDALPALVVVQTHLPEQWEEEVTKFLPKLRVEIAKKGTPKYLPDPWQSPDVLIITYSKLAGWAHFLEGWSKTIIFDEVQELRRPGSNKYAAAKALADDALVRVGLSATPIYNYGAEFHAVFDVLAPGRLGSLDEFLREWTSGYYEARKARIRDPKAFGHYLRDEGLMVRRTREEVSRELPEIVSLVQPVDADTAVLAKAESSAEKLAEIILSQKGTGFDKLQASQRLSSELRQATGVAKAPYVAEFARLLLEQEDEPLVIWGWHREVYGIWEERLKEFGTAWYTGSESPKKKLREKERFLSGDARVLFMSLRSGSGLNGLQEVCSSAIVGELDWSFGVIEQCVGRLHRDGQTKPLMVHYPISTEGADPIMVDVLGLKKQQLDGVRRPFGKLEAVRQLDPEHVKLLAAKYLKKAS